MLAGLVVAFPSLEYAGKMIESAMAFFAAVGHLTVLAVPASAGPDNDADVLDPGPNSPNLGASLN